MDEKLKLVEVYGHLYAGGREYLLLRPFPIARDGWQGDNCYRFLVTPNEVNGTQRLGDERIGVYPYSRHIITNCFTIEYTQSVHDIYIPEPQEIAIENQLDQIFMEEENAEKELPY